MIKNNNFFIFHGKWNHYQHKANMPMITLGFFWSREGRRKRDPCPIAQSAEPHASSRCDSSSQGSRCRWWRLLLHHEGRMVGEIWDRWIGNGRSLMDGRRKGKACGCGWGRKRGDDGRVIGGAMQSSSCRGFRGVGVILLVAAATRRVPESSLCNKPTSCVCLLWGICKSCGLSWLFSSHESVHMGSGSEFECGTESEPHRKGWPSGRWGHMWMTDASSFLQFYF